MTVTSAGTIGGGISINETGVTLLGGESYTYIYTSEGLEEVHSSYGPWVKFFYNNGKICKIIEYGKNNAILKSYEIAYQESITTVFSENCIEFNGETPETKVNKYVFNDKDEFVGMFEVSYYTGINASFELQEPYRRCALSNENRGAINATIRDIKGNQVKTLNSNTIGIIRPSSDIKVEQGEQLIYGITVTPDYKSSENECNLEFMYCKYSVDKFETCITRKLYKSDSTQIFLIAIPEEEYRKGNYYIGVTTNSSMNLTVNSVEVMKQLLTEEIDCVNINTNVERFTESSQIIWYEAKYFFCYCNQKSVFPSRP